MLKTLRLAALTLGAVAGLSRLAQSQARGAPGRPFLADSTPARIMASARHGAFPVGAVVEILRQREQAYPAAKRRELMDSVVALVVGFDGAADDAVISISLAGSFEEKIGGLPDLGAMDRLQEIHRTAVSMENRVSALSEMPNQVQPMRALPYLRSVAVSPTDPTAQSAIEAIGQLAFGPRFRLDPDRQRAALAMRELFDRALVPQGPAHATLCRWAEFLKWPIDRYSKCSKA